MPKDYEQMSRDFLAAAREYRSWDEPRMERELQRIATEEGYELEISETEPGIWRVAFIKRDDASQLGIGPFIMMASETDSRHRAMEDQLLMARFRL
jgi:hypothetical protein